MPMRLSDGVNTEMASASGEDRIGALPDELLQYLMSFLPSRDSVQTCVLAKRWRTLWKSVPALRVSGPRSYNGEPSNTFVNELLRLRDRSSLLNVCDICCPDDVEMDDDFKLRYPHEDQVYFSWHYEAFRYMEPWLRYALSRQVQVLRISFPWLVTNLTLISSHLKRLELYRIRFQECPLDFSSCKVLEVLEMVDCEMWVGITSSQSLQHLDINGGNFVIGEDSRVRISAPNLVSFRLAPSWGLTPLLDSMPSLVSAAVTPHQVCREACYCDNPSCEGCDARPGFSDYPLVLESLSCATNLKLTIADSTRLSVFRMDLNWRPMFRKLKTLFLNQWCVGDDFTGLVYFLQHSPILEMLTLQLDLQTSEEYHLSEAGESCNSSEQLLLAHLKVVKIIRGTQEDVIVHHILKILCTHGVPSEKIEIE